MTARDQYLPLGAKEKRNKMANPGSAKSGVKPSSPKYPNWIPNVLAKRRSLAASGGGPPGLERI